MARTRRLAANLLLLLTCTAILFAVAEMVLRARWEPRARTSAPFVRTRTVTPEYDVEYVTNRQGFRDIDHMEIFNRVAVIGDSFVFGSGVALDSLMTLRLQRLLWRLPFLADVWNFGVPGTGPFNACYLWRDYVKPVRPQVLLVALYAGNDASDALRESREARPRLVTVARAKMLGWRLRTWWQNRKHADPVDNPRAQLTRRAGGWNAFGVDNPATLDALLAAAHSRGVPEDSVRARLAAIPDSLVADALAFRSNPFNLAEAVLDPDGLRHNLLLDTPEMDKGWKALETAVRELEREVDAAGSKLVLVCIPAAVQVDSTYWWIENLGVRLDRRVVEQPEFQNRLARFAASEHIPFVDLLPVMRAHPGQRLYYEHDGHWNARGHEVAARAIADVVTPLLPALAVQPPDTSSGGPRL